MEILALGDRFSPAFTSIKETIEDFGRITYKSEHAFTNMNEAIDFIRDSSFDVVLMPNPYGNNRRKSIYLTLREVNFPVITFDRGALPNSWFFDVGFNADSPSYHPLKWDSELTDNQISEVREYIQEVKTIHSPLESQGKLVGATAIRKKYGLEGKKVLFVAFQRPSDTTIKYFSDPIGSFENFEKMVSEVSDTLSKTTDEWIVVAKKHPLEVESPSANVLFVEENTHINDLIEVSDVVLVVNSGVGLLASLWQKPVLLAGTAFYKSDKLNRVVRSHDDVIYYLKTGFDVDLQACDRLVYHLWKRVYSFGVFHTEKVRQKDNSFRNITRHIDFKRVVLPPVIKKKRVLLITPVVPWPINRGSAHRTDQTIRALVSNGLQVDAIVLNRSYSNRKSVDILDQLEERYPTVRFIVRRHPSFLKKWKIGTLSSRVRYQLENLLDSLTGKSELISNSNECPPNLRRAIKKAIKSKEYDLVIFNYLKTIPPRLKASAPIVADLHDLQTNRIRNDVVPKINPKKQKKYLERFRKSEGLALSSIDLGVAISPVEQKSFEEKFPNTCEFETAVASDDKKINRVLHEERLESAFDLSFVGSNSDANRKGILWFVEECLPFILKIQPNIRFLCQGAICRNPVVQEAFKNSKLENISYRQYVESMDDFYSNTKAIICPVVVGTGMNIKVVEAMSYGTPIVATSIATRGTALGVIQPSADTPEEFAIRCIEVIKSETVLRNLSEKAIEAFDREHSFEKYAERWGEIVLKVTKC